MKTLVKAIVLDNRDYEEHFKRGAVVTLDLSTVNYTTDPLKNKKEAFIAVVGSTWGYNRLSRFGIDPLAK